MSIRLRLTLWYTTVLTLTLLVFGAGLYFFLKTTTLDQYKSSMKNHVNEVYGRMDFNLMPSMEGWYLDFYLDDQDTFLSEGIYLQLVNLSALEVTTSRNAMEHKLRIPYSDADLNQLQQEPSFFETVQIQGHPFLVYHQRIVVKDKLVGVLQAAVYTGSNEVFLYRLRAMLLSASILVVFLAAFLGWFFAKKALQPIDNVIKAAEHIQKGTDLGTRIQYSGPKDEIGKLTDTVNGMLARLQQTYNDLEETYRNQRRFVSDASHELRTPLTTIRGNVDLIEKIWAKQQAAQPASDQDMELSKESLKDIAEEAERMSRLINDMLSLARADAGYKMETEVLALYPIVEEVIRRAQFLPRQAAWRAGDLSKLEGIAVKGSKDYIIQLLFILIENSFKYTEAGEVSLEIKHQAGQVGLSIKDTGIGMDEEEVPQVFERFYRADVSRGQTPGTGLGLSIAKWIIDQHEGSIEVETGKGMGSIFTIWLPIYFHEQAGSVIIEGTEGKGGTDNGSH
jgi:two-component system OmpR family sensor kinase